MIYKEDAFPCESCSHIAAYSKDLDRHHNAKKHAETRSCFSVNSSGAVTIANGRMAWSSRRSAMNAISSELDFCVHSER